jgi:hypothetical protein
MKVAPHYRGIQPEPVGEGCLSWREGDPWSNTERKFPFPRDL